MENNLYIYIMSIYKITGGDLCYIGSTTEKINTRYSKHKANYRVWKSGGKMGHCSSFDIFDTVGIENCKIELLEQTDTLLNRERFYVESMVCVNKKIPNRTKKEYRELHKEYFKEWTKEWRKNRTTPCLPPLLQNNRPNPSETSSPPDSPSL
jgi:hypothetical protein